MSSTSRTKPFVQHHHRYDDWFGRHSAACLSDRESELGQTYLDHQAESVFYREAVFYSAAEIGEVLRAGGFVARAWGQTLFRPLAEITEIEPVRQGTGKGAFVAVTADRIAHDSARQGGPKSTSTGTAR